MLFLLFTFLAIYQTDDIFTLVGFDKNFNPITTFDVCDMQTNCSTVLCNLLANKSLCVSSIGLITYKRPNCGKPIDNHPATMISFIALGNPYFDQPYSCDNIGACLVHQCNIVQNDYKNLAMLMIGFCR